MNFKKSRCFVHLRPSHNEDQSITTCEYYAPEEPFVLVAGFRKFHISEL